MRGTHVSSRTTCAAAANARRRPRARRPPPSPRTRSGRARPRATGAPGSPRRRRGGDRGQRLVVDPDPLGRVRRDGGGLRDHHRHRLAREAGAVRRQRRVRRDEERRAVAAAERKLVRVRRHRPMRRSASPSAAASRPVSTASTPGMASAAARRSRRCARARAGDRTRRAWAWPGRLKSSLKRPRPVIRRASSLRGIGCPKPCGAERVRAARNETPGMVMGAAGARRPRNLTSAQPAGGRQPPPSFLADRAPAPERDA